MLTAEQFIQNPEAIKHLIGIPAETVREMSRIAEAQFPEYRKKYLAQKQRQRAVGAGRPSLVSLTARLLALLVYFRLNITQRAVAALFVDISQSRISRDLRLLVPFLQRFVPTPEVWEPDCERQEAENRIESARVIVDATEQPVYRSQDNVRQKAYYSGKQKMHTLKTQVATDDEHAIIAVSTAFPGSVHDKKVAEEVGTIERLGDGVELMGDKGYQGLQSDGRVVRVRWNEGDEEDVFLPRVSVRTPTKKPKGGELTQREKDRNRKLSSVRVRVEHCIGWVKNFKICGERFRCSHSVYTPILRLVCGFVNLQTQRWRQVLANKDV